MNITLYKSIFLIIIFTVSLQLDQNVYVNIPADIEEIKISEAEKSKPEILLKTKLKLKFIYDNNFYNLENQPSIIKPIKCFISSISERSPPV